ncbi:MAG: hypothetical protein J6V66_03170, partial [Clostridia bacterium]|nr:hypothetical protein [Clostridia bacterium]
MELTKGAKLLIKTLNDHGYKGYAVGGFVRDNLLGKPVFDVDVTTDATPDQILKVFKDFKVYLTGIKHGTVTVNSLGEHIEVTTYRVDGEYNDNRHPDTVKFVTDLSKDLARRDFTVNAMAFDGEEIIDLYGGREDLKNKIIKAVGDPYQRFEEDALRILRGLRFASTLGFEIDIETARAMEEKAHLLKNVSVERIFVELTKLLLGKGVESVLTKHKNVIFTVIPELKLCDGFDQNTKYHSFDVYMHTVKSVALSEADKAVRWALLLHDIEKPSCYTVDGNGVGHFYGHQPRSAKTAVAILKRFKADNKLIKLCNDLIYLHDIKTEISRAEIKKLLRSYGAETIKKLACVKVGDGVAHAPEYAKVRRELSVNFQNAVEDIIEKGECYLLKDLKVNGNDFKLLGYKGLDIKNALEKALSLVINGEVQNDKSEILKRFER